MAAAKGFCIITLMGLADEIKNRAIELGFDLVGITDASPLAGEQVEFLTEWLKAGLAGEMSYMHHNLDKRIDPAKLLENAQSVIVVALNYGLPAPQSKPSAQGGLMGRVANYAQYEDYHLFMKRGLRQLANSVSRPAGAEALFKVCVDSAPLAERALAARAGLGFIGKNHMLINPELGPEVFLGEIVTTLKLQPDRMLAGSCAGCNRCIEACPTGALREDGQFDARRCISYLTIEYKRDVPGPLAERIGDWLFGCDECVLACPYQAKAPACRNTLLKSYPDRAELNLEGVLEMTDESFESRFGDTPLKRAGLDLLKRNARICLANLTDCP